MPTGVTVADDGRIFVCYPRWGDRVDFTVAEVRDGAEGAYPDAPFKLFGEQRPAHRPRPGAGGRGGAEVACPDAEFTVSDEPRPADCLVSVQSVVVDPAGRLW